MDDPIKQTLIGLRLSQLHKLADLTYHTGLTRSEMVRDAIDVFLKEKLKGGDGEQRTS